MMDDVSHILFYFHSSSNGTSGMKEGHDVGMAEIEDGMVTASALAVGCL